MVDWHRLASKRLYNLEDLDCWCWAEETKTYGFIESSEELDVRLKELRGLLKRSVVWVGERWRGWFPFWSHPCVIGMPSSRSHSLHSISRHDSPVFTPVTKSPLIQFHALVTCSRLCSLQGRHQGPTYLWTQIGSIMKLHATLISKQITSFLSHFFGLFSQEL